MTHAEPRILLHARNLRRSYSGGGSRFTLQTETVILRTLERVAIVGPSGSGKSTVLGLLSLALIPDDIGPGDRRLTLGGDDALARWRRGDSDGLARLRANAIGFVPQTAALLPFLTLRENIRLPQQITGKPNKELLQYLAEALRIADILDRRPAQVSVGQRQRAAVARALAHLPQIVLADEPTASVHPTQADEILQLLIWFSQHTGAALLITTHDAARAGAAGFAIAPCVADPHASLSRFVWDSTTASATA